MIVISFHLCTMKEEINEGTNIIGSPLMVEKDDGRLLIAQTFKNLLFI